MSLNRVRLIKLPRFKDERGSLAYVQNKKQIPFDIKRIYYLYDLPKKAIRGEHAHRDNYGLLIAASGSFTVQVDDTKEKKQFHLSSPTECLLIPPLIWRTLYDFTPNSICFALGSVEYNEDEYIRNYDEFTEIISNL